MRFLIRSSVVSPGAEREEGVGVFSGCISGEVRRSLAVDGGELRADEVPGGVSVGAGKGVFFFFFFFFLCCSAPSEGLCIANPSAEIRVSADDASDNGSGGGGGVEEEEEKEDTCTGDALAVAAAVIMSEA